jgi:DNA-binding beta-propeller fold protein YncE
MFRRTAPLAIIPALICLIFVGIRSTMETHAQSESPSPGAAPIQFIGVWGVKGSEPGHLDQATCIATDALGDVFIADAGSRFIHKFAPQGTPLLSFQDDWIKSPQSIAVDRGGAIYTADASRGGVSVFLPTGDRYRDLKLKGRPNAEDTLGVTIGDDGLIFVLDRNSSQVFVYTPAFRLTQTWRPFASSSGRASAIAYGPDGYVYALDRDDNRIGRFTESGHVVSEIVARRPGSARRLGDQFAVSNGYVFLMDGDGLTLHIFTSDGMPKMDFDLSPQLGNQHRFVPALAISPRRELFVLDSPNSRVLRYRIDF